jgi:hypothetical protein
MRALLVLGLGCVLVVGCASPSPPPKPSPYRLRTPERIEVRSPSCPESIHP